MVPFELFLKHLFGLGLVWFLTLLGGFSLSTILKIRLGFIGYLMLGIVFWSVALFVIPFKGGLYIALALATAISVVGIKRGDFRHKFAWQRDHIIAGAILTLGCTVYASLLLWNFAPMGNDATMLGTAARIVAYNRGLPQSYAPILPELYFPSVNLGLPSVGGTAIMLGAEVNSTVLGLAQMSYSAWILATFLVLRLWVRPPAAAILAVAQAWDARWAQNTITWGGFSTVASMAVGVFAVRLIWQYSRRFSWRSGIAIGLTAATMPLVHGISAAVWLYAVAPVLFLAIVLKSKQRMQTFKQLALAGVVGVSVIGVYLAVGQVRMSESAKEWTRHHIAEDAPKPGNTVQLLSNSFDYLAIYGNNIFIWLGIGSCVLLAIFGRWRIAAGILISLMVLVLIMANAHWQILPGTALLYPNRAVYWVGPITAVAAAQLWRVLRVKYPQPEMLRTGVGIGIALLAITALQHVNQYQIMICNPVIQRDGWDALKWVEQNLRSPQTFVHATPHNVGSQLPVCAGVATDAWHIHHMAMDEWETIRLRKPITHTLVIRGLDPLPEKGRIIYENPTVVIFDLRAQP
jgi:hypothetical protein